MTNLYDPVDEARSIGLFNERTPKGVLDMRGVGGEVGWYLRPDGQAVRLPADTRSRDRYEQKGFVFKRQWGVYARTPVEVNGRDIPAETEWEQLSRLAREHPDETERLAIRHALGVVFSTSTRIADEVIICACGQEYTRRPAYENHLYGCGRALAAELDAEKAANVGGAPAEAKPPKPATCRVNDCGLVFETEGERLRHWHATHKKAKKAATNAG